MNAWRCGRCHAVGEDAGHLCPSEKAAVAPPVRVSDNRCEFCGTRCAGEWCGACSTKVADLTEGY